MSYRRAVALIFLVSMAGAVALGTGCAGNGENLEKPSVPTSAPAAAPGPSGYQEIEVSDGGTVEGMVVLPGPVPAPKKIRVARPSDQTVCGTEKISEAIRVGPSGEVRDAVVTLDGIRRGKPLSSLPAPPPVDQVKCDYAPHVTIYPAGTPLQLRSDDAILHNVHAYVKGGETLFNAAMPRKGMQISKPLPGTGWVSLKCDVHAWMNGAVWITDHPYVAVTDASGKFSLGQVPPGRYSVKAWHPVLGEGSQPVEVRAGESVTVNLQLSPGH